MQSASVCLDGYHLGDIIVSPPTGWGNTRKLAYFDWAKSVIDGLLCAHPTKRTVIPRRSMEMSRGASAVRVFETTSLPGPDCHVALLPKPDDSGKGASAGQAACPGDPFHVRQCLVALLVSTGPALEPISRLLS